MFKVSVLGGLEHAHGQVPAREFPVPHAKLGRSPVLVIGRGAGAAQFLTLAVFKACPVEKRGSIPVAPLH